jgi:protein-S-isoprenylcysteine O-methyltransferase Ste14
MTGRPWLYLRALAAFLALPGVVAGVIPFFIVRGDPFRSTGFWFGVLILAAGLAGLLLCVREFLVSGRGTLAPWDPPKRLVGTGLYRFTRNPMYESVILITAGWALLSGSPLLAAYTVVIAIAIHLRVTMKEEPWLHRQFGGEWESYRHRVNRWIPRRHNFL